MSNMKVSLKHLISKDQLTQSVFVYKNSGSVYFNVTADVAHLWYPISLLNLPILLSHLKRT